VVNFPKNESRRNPHHDEEAFGGYRTQDLILTYMKAHDAGDVDSRAAV
jgi:hypothetical protein